MLFRVPYSCFSPYACPNTKMTCFWRPHLVFSAFVCVGYISHWLSNINMSPTKSMIGIKRRMKFCWMLCMVQFMWLKHHVWFGNRSKVPLILQPSHSLSLVSLPPSCRASEEAFLAETDGESPGSEWERVARLCDFNPKTNKTAKDVSRMRSVLISLKQTPLVR